jgi:hypothetical protein
METLREITSHQVNPVNQALKIGVHDEPGPGGASTLYSITVPDVKYGNFTAPAMVTLKFQNGPAAEGVNGITHEALLAILIDRLEGFQNGPFSHYDNEMALNHLKDATAALARRTRDRIARGVEGTRTP